MPDDGISMKLYPINEKIKGCSCQFFRKLLN